MLEQVIIPANLYNWIYGYLNNRPRVEVNDALNTLDRLVAEQAQAQGVAQPAVPQDEVTGD